MIATTPEDVTPDASFLRRFAAFLDERFPVVPHLFLAAALYTGCQAAARVAAGAAGPFAIDLPWLAGVFTVFLGLYHFRVFDEHKDYEEDLEYNPQRVVQRGVFTLDELKVTAVVAIAGEAALSAAIGVPAFAAWAIGFGISLLLLKEYFLSEWLDDHFLVYGFSHLVGWVPMAFFAFSATTGAYPWDAPLLFWLFGLGVYALVSSWEIARKMRVPGQTPRRADAYTEHFGIRGAAWAIVAARLIAIATAAVVGWVAVVGWWLYAGLAILYAATSLDVVAYLRDPSPEHAVGLRENGETFLVGFNLVVAGAFAFADGVSLGVIL